MAARRERGSDAGERRAGQRPRGPSAHRDREKRRDERHDRRGDRRGVAGGQSESPGRWVDDAREPGSGEIRALQRERRGRGGEPGKQAESDDLAAVALVRRQPGDRESPADAEQQPDIEEASRRPDRGLRLIGFRIDRRQRVGRRLSDGKRHCSGDRVPVFGDHPVAQGVGSTLERRRRGRVDQRAVRRRLERYGSGAPDEPQRRHGDRLVEGQSERGGGVGERRAVRGRRRGQGRVRERRAGLGEREQDGEQAKDRPAPPVLFAPPHRQGFAISFTPGAGFSSEDPASPSFGVSIQRSAAPPGHSWTTRK